jgi:hypothetical protein
MRRTTEKHTNQIKQAHNISIIFSVCRKLLLPRRQSTASQASQSSISAGGIASAVHRLSTARSGGVRS